MGTKARRPTRRQVLLGLSATIPSISLPFSAKPSGRDQVDRYAVAKVNELVAGRKVSLDLLLPNGSGPNVRPVVEAFHQATGVQVRMTETPVDDIVLQLTLDSLGKDGSYDLALPATFGVPDLVESGAIVPITEFTKQHEPDGFRNNVLYRIGDTFDNETFGFQTDGDAYVMFYHKDFLQNPDEKARYSDTFGYELAAPDTWEELDRQIQYFHRPEQNLCGGLLFRTPGYIAWEWWVRFHAKGVWPFSNDLVPQIAGDAGVAALDELVAVSEFLCPETGSLGLFENWKRYAKGDIYCNIGWGGSQKYLNGPASDMRGRMLHRPTPGGEIDGELLVTPYFNWGWNYVVTSQSTEPEIAYLFALFASSSRMSTLSVRQQEGYFDPFRTEHYDDTAIKAAYSEEFLQVHFESMKQAVPDLYLAHQGAYFRALSDWIIRALNKDVPPKEALARVAENWELISRRTDFDRQRKRWQELRAKYPASIRSRLRDL